LRYNAISDWQSDAEFWTVVAAVPSLLIGFVLHYVEQFRSRKPNGVLLVYWLLAFIAQFYKAYQLYEAGNDESFNLYNILWAIAAANSFIVLTVEWLAPKYINDSYIELGEDDEEEELSPYEKADLFSRVTFAWMSPLMKLGYKKFLTEKDLPPLPNSTKTETTSVAFEEAWQYQVDNKTSSLLMTTRATPARYRCLAALRLRPPCFLCRWPRLQLYTNTSSGLLKQVCVSSPG
jgi:hypothetical protein